MSTWMKQKLHEKGGLYSNLNMEDITNADYMNVKRLCKDVRNKNFNWISWFVSWKWSITFGWCFENLTKMCSNIYHLDHPVKVLSTPGLAWQAALKTIELKLKLLIYIDMLLIT